GRKNAAAAVPGASPRGGAPPAATSPPPARPTPALSAARQSDRMAVAAPRVQKETPSHAARLDRHRLCARLYRPAVRDRELRRPHPPLRPRRPLAALHLSALARHLLHVLDVFRLGRARLSHRLRFPHHIRPSHPHLPLL